MEIRDVIGALRERDLDLQQQINALRLDVHVLAYRLSKVDDRGLKAMGDNDNGAETPLVTRDGEITPEAQAGVGAADPRPRAKRNHARRGD